MAEKQAVYAALPDAGRVRHRRSRSASEEVRRMLEQSVRWGSVVGLGCLVQTHVSEDLLDDIGVFNASDDLHLSSALLTLLNIYGEHTLETLRTVGTPGPWSKPWASAVLLARSAVGERRVCEACCWERTPHEIL